MILVSIVTLLLIIIRPLKSLSGSYWIFLGEINFQVGCASISACDNRFSLNLNLEKGGVFVVTLT